VAGLELTSMGVGFALSYLRWDFPSVFLVSILLLKPFLNLKTPRAQGFPLLLRRLSASGAPRQQQRLRVNWPTFALQHGNLWLCSVRKAEAPVSA